MTLDEIFANVITEPNCGCWIWNGKWNLHGYALTDDGRPAYRVSYELVNGPIAFGMHIDHLCRVKCCVNPVHLEQVSRNENFRRKRIFGRSVKAIDLTNSQKIKTKPQEVKQHEEVWSENWISIAVQKIGISQTELAKWLRVHDQAIHHYVRGTRLVPPALMLLIELINERPELVAVVRKIADRIQSQDNYSEFEG